MPEQTPSGLSSKFYELGEDGNFNRIEIKRTSIVSIDKQIRSLAADIATVIPRVSTAQDRPVHMVSSNKELVILARLPSIKLATYFVVKPALRRGQPARIVPCFRHDTSSIQLAPIWTPPPSMALWLCVHFAPQTEGQVARYQMTTLVATCLTGGEGTAGTYKPCLPNIHADSHVCMGADPSRIQAPDTAPLTAFSNALTIFQNNRWNHDLLDQNRIEVIEESFAFDAADNTTQLTCPADWPTKWAKVANRSHDPIPFKLLA